MSCDLSRSLLHGYLDGELDPMRAEEFERHLESCSQCIAQLGEQESLRASLQSAQLYERARLRALSTKIKRQIASAEAESDDQWSWVPIWRWIAVSAAIVVLVAVAYLGGGEFCRVGLASSKPPDRGDRRACSITSAGTFDGRRLHRPAQCEAVKFDGSSIMFLRCATWPRADFHWWAAVLTC